MMSLRFLKCLESFLWSLKVKLCKFEEWILFLSEQSKEDWEVPKTELMEDYTSIWRKSCF